VAYGPKGDSGESFPPNGGVWEGWPSEANAVPGINPAWLAGSADRERAVSVLRAGFTEGRLTQDELDDRVAQAYAARTYGQLWALTADLPAGPLPGPQFPPALPHQGPGAVLPPAAAPASNWRSAAALVITALVIFMLAALVTAIITTHTQAVPFRVQQVNLQPYITYQQPAAPSFAPVISRQP
jgi:Domain of unknown function (DUF1707)